MSDNVSISTSQEQFIFRLEQAIGSKTQREVARLTDISGSVISQYLNGKSEPKRPNLEKLAKGLNVSPAWLAFGEGDLIQQPSSDTHSVISSVEAIELESEPKTINITISF